MNGTAEASAVFTTDEVWLDGWRGPSVLRTDGVDLHWVGPAGTRSGTIDAHIPGTIVGGFTDSHVHLGLIDPSLLVAGGIARVVDLGGDPVHGAARRRRGETDLEAVQVDFAGPFLTAPGGYPSDRSWAPASSVRQVATPVESAAAIAEIRSYGVDRIKITLNTVAGAVWDDRMLATVVSQAHAAGLPVVAHGEGAGQAMRAARAGVDMLAHTPFTERLGDDDIAALAGSVAVISTLDIHGYGDPSESFAVASDNLARFQAAGGRVLYGTDLGNGPLPVGINERELTALATTGLDLEALLGSLGARRSGSGFTGRVSRLPGAVPRDPTEVAHWLSTASVLAVPALKESFA
ncbi:amidohydrolase family protein [Lacisediminihabitans sp. FW035]